MAARNVEYIIGLRDKFSNKIGRIQNKTKALDQQLNSLRSTIGVLFAGFAAQRVIGDIIKVGSNFEQLQISFETMLGSAERATKLVKDLTKFAIETPFELKDVSAGAKSLLAFGIAQEKIIPTLKSLGDVAAGLSIPIERLILNFGQVKTQSKLTGRELRDFAIAGVPLLAELAKVMGKSTSEVTKLVSAGKVGFPIVEQAFKNMSGEGGKFFDLMQKQTASTGGQISNLRDVISLLENDIFKKLQPTINRVVIAIQDWTAFLRKNIDTVVEIIKLTGKFIKLLITYKILQLSVNVVVRGAAIANRVFATSTIFMNSNLIRSIRLLRGFKLALARTGIGLLLLALTELIIQFTGLEKAIFGATEAQKEFSKQREKIKTLDTEIQQTTFLFKQRKRLDDTAIVRLKKRLESTLSLANAEKQLALEQIQAANQQEGKVKGVKDEIALFTKLFLAQEKFTDARKESEELTRKIAIVTQLAKGRGINVAGADLLDKFADEQQTQLAGVTRITSAAPKVFNINIEKQIENVIFNTETGLKEGVTQVKEMLTEALTGALNDLQLNTR